MTAGQRKNLWPRAGLWLLFLGPFFFLTYGWAAAAAKQAQTAEIFFEWERGIPFWSWTIVPYWSLDLLYALSLFLCTSRKELRTHALRLAAASAVCCLCFVLYPMTFSFVRPESGGIFGSLFSALETFDAPYNQAPSLHIALAWIVWLRFRAHSRGWTARLCAGWFLLVGLSVLTTWQHHFIDVPSGLCAGLLITYFLPVKTYPRAQKPFDPAKSFKLALLYAAGAALFAAAAFWLKGWGWILCWPAFALGAVAAGYAGLGPRVFQKDAKGRVSLSSFILLAPYRWAAALSRRYFTRKTPLFVQLAKNLYLGSFPDDAKNWDCLLDLTGEFPSPKTDGHTLLRALPRMDLTAQSPRQINRAVRLLGPMRRRGKTLVFCALGLSRSAAVAAAALAAQQDGPDLKDALETVRRLRPQSVWDEAQIRSLSAWEKIYRINKNH